MDNLNVSYNYKEPYRHTASSLHDSDKSSTNDRLSEQSDGQNHCFCCDSDIDSVDKDRLEKARDKFFKKCFRICLLSCIIIGYTFIGAVIFLVNEDNVTVMTEQITSALISDKLIPPGTNDSAYKWFSKLGEESRNKAVQNIWNITVNLNILYRQNWTILAAEELNNFQERLLEKLWQEKMYLESLSFNQEAQRTTETPPTHWKLGKAFLYSMSILSTIGKSFLFLTFFLDCVHIALYTF